jgi:long-chain acyl-CoA synthetase
MNLVTLFESTAQRHPARVALVEGDRRITYRELQGLVMRVAGGLRQAGFAPGARIALICPNRIEFVAAYWAILRCGMTVVPMNFLMKPEDFAYQLQHCGAQGVIAFEGHAPLPIAHNVLQAIEKLSTPLPLWIIPSGSGLLPNERAHSWDTLANVPESADDCFPAESAREAIISYTSGTTGRPKGAVITHENDFTNALGMAAIYGLNHRDVVLAVAPLFTAIGQVLLLNPTLGAGGTLVLLPRFDAQTVWTTMVREKVSVFVGVPAMYYELANTLKATGLKAEDLARHWRLGIHGGSVMPDSVHERFELQFPGVLRIAYGLTEARLCAVSPAPGEQTQGPRALVAGMGVEARAVGPDMRPVPLGEAGELVLRGANIMQGYLDNPEANAETFRGGWFHTGDVVRFDEQGCFRIVDRMKDMLDRGGYKVYPRQVEDMLERHPAVARAAVIGVPDEKYGQEIKAFVLFAAGAECSVEELAAWAKEHIAVHMYPRIIERVDALPIGATGKIMKHLLPK